VAIWTGWREQYERMSRSDAQLIAVDQERPRDINAGPIGAGCWNSAKAIVTVQVRSLTWTPNGAPALLYPPIWRGGCFSAVVTVCLRTARG